MAILWLWILFIDGHHRYVFNLLISANCMDYLHHSYSPTKLSCLFFVSTQLS